MDKNEIRRKKYYRKTFWNRVIKKLLRLINYCKLEYSREYYKKNREHLCRNQRDRHLQRVLKDLAKLEKNIIID